MRSISPGKLASVLHGCADPSILDSYEPERIAFAHRLVASTDRVFTFVTRDGAIARFMRLHVAPHVIPAAFASDAFRRFMFRTVSQTVVNYRGSALSEGAAGRVQGGDRLPWVPSAVAADQRGGNFEPLKALDWQVHVYGDCPPDLARLCDARHLRLHSFEWRTETESAGLARNGVYLVRPDGYIALADHRASVATLQAFLDARRLRPLALRSPTM